MRDHSWLWIGEAGERSVRLFGREISPYVVRAIMVWFCWGRNEYVVRDGLVGSVAVAVAERWCFLREEPW